METAAANDSCVCPVGKGKDTTFTKLLLFLKKILTNLQ